jgi:Cytochrome b(C-terminal)/b6/petD
MNSAAAHGFESVAEWNTVQTGLGVFYLLVVLLNLGFALYQGKGKRDARAGLYGAIWSVVFLVLAIPYLAHSGWQLGGSFRGLTTRIMGAAGGQAGPILYTTLSVAGFLLFLYYRKFLTVAWAIMNLSFIVGGWSMTDPEFKKIIAKEDNVPITMLIYTVGFFTWLAMRKAVVNDDRIAKGEPPVETLENEKVLVWPDLVYTELICMVVVTFLLVIWAVVLKAPLEQPATSAKAPNPSKAPWYFLGLQEMLVYYDPWIAGIVLPLMIIQGLITIPYIDFNQKGNGYFTFAQRKFAITVFMIGFVVMWVTLIVLGTFLRGPNWNFFGPYEYWDPHKVLPLNNVNLSDYFWLNTLHTTLPDNWFIRELPGILVVLGYFFLLPPLLARTIMRPFFIKMGFVRFFLLVNLLQLMASLPIKMVLRWLINLKYIVYIPEYFFNI